MHYRCLRRENGERTEVWPRQLSLLSASTSKSLLERGTSVSLRRCYSVPLTFTATSWGSSFPRLGFPLLHRGASRRPPHSRTRHLQKKHTPLWVRLCLCRAMMRVRLPLVGGHVDALTESWVSFLANGAAQRALPAAHREKLTQRVLPQGPRAQLAR